MDPSFVPSLPGVRQLQSWTRDQRVISVELVNGNSLEGVLQWQDPQFLALRRSASEEPVLISRQAVLMIRLLG